MEKYSFTWWVGWVVLYPVRLFIALAMAFIVAASPTFWKANQEKF
jgi:hypothetical protein